MHARRPRPLHARFAVQSYTPRAGLGVALETMCTQLLPGSGIAAVAAFGIEDPDDATLFLGVPQAWKIVPGGGSPVSPSDLPRAVADGLLGAPTLTVLGGLDTPCPRHAWVVAGAGWHMVASGYDGVLTQLSGAADMGEDPEALCRATNPFADVTRVLVRADGGSHARLEYMDRLTQAAPVIAAWVARTFDLDHRIPGAALEISFTPPR